jgi:hypothetical protein
VPTSSCFEEGDLEAVRPVCLGCGARSKVGVVYGYPTPELLEQARRGEVILGGCNVGAPPPPWLCAECERDESKRELLAENRRQLREEERSEATSVASRGRDLEATRSQQWFWADWIRSWKTRRRH